MLRQLKKILSIIIILGLVLIPIPVIAEGISMVIKVSPSQPVVGQEISIEIGIDRILNVKNYDFTVTYDVKLFNYDSTATTIIITRTAP